MHCHKFLDFLIIGEGEPVFGQWCRALKGEIPYGQVRGLAYREHETVFINPPPAPYDFKESPSPYQAFPCERDKVIYYEASRGCPFQCSYCISSLDRKIRELPVERVKADMDYFLHKEIKQVKFLDRTFNWDQERSLELFKYIMERDRGVTNFHFEICADLLDIEILRLLRNARKGLFQFEIGIQSTNKKALVAVNRHSDIEKTLGNVRQLIEMGNSHIHVDLIAGLPYEDDRSFRTSFNDVYALGADNLQLGFLKLLKGTEMRKAADLYHYTYMSKAPYQVISNDFMTAGELCRLKQIETVLDLYHNRGGFENTLQHAVAQQTGGPFEFYERFAQYYYGRGFQHRSHKKEDLYRIFYQYANFEGENSKLSQLLELDLGQTMNFDAVKKFNRKGWVIL